MSKIYCGSSKVPKGQTLGTMKECVAKNQVRYWGVKKVDSRLLKKESIKKEKSTKESRDKAAIKMIGLRGKVQKLTKQVSEEKDKKKKLALSKELEKAKKEFSEAVALFNKLEKQRGQSRTSSRKNSRKSSRKGSRKGSRKSSKK
ncbi:hypothetical protein Indivirus_1_169 [Indivirus ILV1]|uniref:Uncharacterized protein n=1 Tax=Indivirus ILV1 TaxID=1977633 RepID=A0A1V0SCV7_9VIRU|nr:hypothetical protein Indivirus_1_169 [Indivirus ILV1]